MKGIWVILFCCLSFAVSAVVPDLGFRGVDCEPSVELRGDSVATFPLEIATEADCAVIEIGMKSKAPQRRKWHLTLSADSITLDITLSATGSRLDDEFEKVKFKVDVATSSGFAQSSTVEADTKEVSDADYLRVVIQGDSTYIYVGSPVLHYVAGVPGGENYREAKVRHTSSGIVERFVCGYYQLPALLWSDTPSEEEILLKIEGNKDPHVGYWRFIDEDVYDDRAIKAGKYLLAIVPAECGAYEIVYVDGVERRDNRWETGMLKGILTPTPIAENYDLQWFDYQGNLLADGLNATFDPVTLALYFPFQRALLRFVKLPAAPAT